MRRYDSLIKINPSEKSERTGRAEYDSQLTFQTLKKHSFSRPIQGVMPKISVLKNNKWP